MIFSMGGRRRKTTRLPGPAVDVEGVGREEYVRETAGLLRIPELERRVVGLRGQIEKQIMIFGEAEVRRVAALRAIEFLGEERELSRKRTRELKAALLEVGAETQRDDDKLSLSFETEAGKRVLEIVFGTGPRVLDERGSEILLPTDVFIAVSGFIARREFPDAVILLKAYFEKEGGT